MGNLPIAYCGEVSEDEAEDEPPRTRGLGTTEGARNQTVVVKSNNPDDQESDLMEKMQNGTFAGDSATARVPLVSLGSSCGPKLTFKDIGRGAETLPFDWAKTRIDAVLLCLQLDFESFYHYNDVVQFQDAQGSTWKGFRSPYHSFWHDDPTHPAMKERYDRRIDRFLSMDATSEPMLFVRSVAETKEIARTEELLELLIEKFGDHAKLLLMVDFQGVNAAGACVVDGYEENLLIHYLDTERASSGAAPYGEAVMQALSWSLGRKIKAKQLPDMETAVRIAKPTDWGMYMSGAPAFYQGAPQSIGA